MGLDTVELIMAIEEEFGVEIPNQDAAKLAILGDLQNYVVNALKLQGQAPNEENIWNRLSAVVVRQLGVNPKEVTRTAHIVKDLRAD